MTIEMNNAFDAARNLAAINDRERLTTVFQEAFGERSVDILNFYFEASSYPARAAKNAAKKRP